jgi:hypothetical protein
MSQRFWSDQPDLNAQMDNMEICAQMDESSPMIHIQNRIPCPPIPLPAVPSSNSVFATDASDYSDLFYSDRFGTAPVSSPIEKVKNPHFDPRSEFKGDEHRLTSVPPHVSLLPLRV